MRNFLTLLITLGTLGAGVAQSTTEKPVPTGFEKKFRWGFTFTAAGSTIEGSPLAADYFAKPSLGSGVAAEYYPLSFLGFGVGAAYQQRGAGILNHNTNPSSVIDSTYRERLRFNTLEFPLSISIRTPKDLLKGLRISGSLGVVPVINLSSKDVFSYLEPSLHNLDHVMNVSSSYFKNDTAYQFSLGPEINAGATGIIKVHFLYSKGTSNVYTAGQGTGHNRVVGVRLSILL